MVFALYFVLIIASRFICKCILYTIKDKKQYKTVNIWDAGKYKEKRNMKKRVLLRVAYDGTNYHGWQVQPGAVTIEQVLNEKLTEL